MKENWITWNKRELQKWWINHAIFNIKIATNMQIEQIIKERNYLLLTNDCW